MSVVDVSHDQLSAPSHFQKAAEGVVNERDRIASLEVSGRVVGVRFLTRRGELVPFVHRQKNPREVHLHQTPVVIAVVMKHQLLERIGFR